VKNRINNKLIAVFHCAFVSLCLCVSLMASGRETPLITAVKANDIATVRTLVKDASKINTPETDGTTALHWAVREDHLEIVRLLLANGADVKASNRYGVTPLALAAESGNTAVIELLLHSGADANEALPEGETVLMTAARAGHTDAVKVLLKAGARPDARESFHGETALIWAAAENHADTVRALLAGGTDVNGRSNKESYQRRNQGLTVLPLGEWTPLMYAAREGSAEAVGALTEGGADVNLKDPDGATALVLAIINSQFHVASILLDKGAEPNLADSTGMAALYAAVDMHTLPWMFGRPDPVPRSNAVNGMDIIRKLLDKGANPNATLSGVLLQRLHTDGDVSLGAGSTPFLRAAKSGDVEVMRLLLQYGANPKSVSKDGATAIMLAAGLGYRDGNAAVPTRDRGTDAEVIAAISMCLDLGLDINATNGRGDTALHAAVAGRGSDDVLRFLVSHGAKIDAKNAQGRSALDVATASRKDRSSNVAILRELMNRE
jgi:ankyrin repeat protein